LTSSSNSISCNNRKKGWTRVARWHIFITKNSQIGSILSFLFLVLYIAVLILAHLIESNQIQMIGCIT
jgi:uncharacterized protein YybS (DUF2232 family)